MYRVYVLNNAFECVSQTSLGRAITLVEQRKAEVVRWADKVINTANDIFRVPMIIRIFKYVKAFGRALKYANRFVWERDEYQCFVPWTRILMADGNLKPISEIKVEDEVLDCYGKRQTVLGVVPKEHSGTILRIRTRRNGDSLELTPNHRILSCNKIGEFDASGTEASLVSSKNYLFSPLILDVKQVVGTIDLFTFLTDVKYLKQVGDSTIKHYCGKPTKRFLKLDENCGLMVGFFLAEGSSHIRNQTSFAFHLKETEYAKSVASIIFEKFGVKCYEEVIEGKHLRIVHCLSSVVWAFVRRFCYVDNGKRLSQKKYPYEFLKGVLKGMLFGDGAFAKELFRCTLQLQPEDLVRDMWVVASMLGLHPSLSKTGFRSDGRHYKAIVFQAQEYDKLIDMLGISSDCPKHGFGKQDFKIVGDLVLSKIVSIEEVNYDGVVFDLEVSGSHTYIANFVAVHNCQYCGEQITEKRDLTTDHVLPKSRGGKTIYENMVTCCRKCNGRKDNKTCDEAKMWPKKKPFRPQMSRSMAKIVEVARELLAEEEALYTGGPTSVHRPDKFAR